MIFYIYIILIINCGLFIKNYKFLKQKFGKKLEFIYLFLIFIIFILFFLNNSLLI